MLHKTGKLKLTLSGDREIVITREFNAARRLVWDAMTIPELVRQWLLGPEGWSMPVCEIDLRVGGAYRYVWQNVSGARMGMGGVYKEVAPIERIVATEKFDESWYPGEAIDTSVFTERAGKTTVTMTVQYQSKEARDAVLKTPMADGMEMGYARLEALLEKNAGGTGATLSHIVTPEIVTTTAQQAAVIRLMIPRSEIQKVMGPAMGEVMSTIAAQGLKPTGPMFSHHFKMAPDTFDFEVGVPVSSEVKPSGRVKAGELPGAKVVRTTYAGPYENLGAAWCELEGWIKGKGMKVTSNIWERYVSGPESSADPAKWRTELNHPLVG